MRFKIIKNKAGQFRCQLIGDNGKVVWWTENYKRRMDAVDAIDLLYQVSSQEEDPPLEDVDEAEADTEREAVEGAEVEG